MAAICANASFSVSIATPTSGPVALAQRPQVVAIGLLGETPPLAAADGAVVDHMGMVLRLAVKYSDSSRVTINIAACAAMA